jgi:SAM-dependent methyltransferase
MKLFDAGTAYEAVLDRNYMFHAELHENVERIMSLRRQPFTILDLGCGTVRHLARTLRRCNIAAYTGFDLSESALQEARRNLAPLNCPVALHHGDMLDGLTSATQRYDVIFSSFALHHLLSEQKAVFLEHAHRVLRDDGVMLLIDIAREPGEDRDAYIEAACHLVTTEWIALSPEARSAFCDHTRECDFPETSADIHTLAVRAGFTECREVNHPPRRYLWSLTKALSQTQSF